MLAAVGAGFGGVPVRPNARYQMAKSYRRARAEEEADPREHERGGQQHNRGQQPAVGGRILENQQHAETAHDRSDKGDLKSPQQVLPPRAEDEEERRAAQGDQVPVAAAHQFEQEKCACAVQEQEYEHVGPVAAHACCREECPVDKSRKHHRVLVVRLQKRGPCPVGRRLDERPLVEIEVVSAGEPEDRGCGHHGHRGDDEPPIRKPSG